MLSELCNQILTWTNLQTVPVRVPAMQDKVMLCSYSGPDYRGASLDGQVDEFYDFVSTEFSQSDSTEESCVQVEEVKVEDEEEEVEEPVTAVAVELKEARGPCGLQGSIALHTTPYRLARAASCRSRVICQLPLLRELHRRTFLQQEMPQLCLFCLTARHNQAVS